MSDQRILIRDETTQRIIVRAPSESHLHVGPTPPTDTSKIWIDTSGV